MPRLAPPRKGERRCSKQNEPLMFRRRNQLGFPRKVVAYYLLFCLVAVCWFAVGVVVTTHTLDSSRAINACLARLGKTAAAVEIEYLRHGDANLSTVLKTTQVEADLAYCAIVGSDGNYIAHTDEGLQGKHAAPATGSLVRWGEVTGVRFVDSLGRILHEYRTPLVARGASFGSLRIAVVEPAVWHTIWETAQVAPIALIVPSLLVLGGAVVLSRLAAPVAGVDAQLRKLALHPPGTLPQLDTLPARDAVALGWNRLIQSLERLQHKPTGGDLEQRLADAVAARKENLLSDVFQNLADGVAVTNAEGRITFANRAIAALLGEEITDEALQGLEIESCLNADAPCFRGTDVFDPQSGNRAAIAEMTRRHGDSDRIIRVARHPLRSEEQKGQIWSLRDITQQKLAEQMRDQFIDTATHELRTPLANIKAYAETLSDSARIDVEQQKEFCNIINSEVTRLARFVDDLLSISSMEVGSLSAERQKVETSRLFDEVLAKVRPLMDLKNQKLEVRLPEKMVDLHLDKEKIIAVLVNLLGNASKYTPEEGSVALKVQIDQEQLQVAVVDTGIGIADHELPKVFDKFFRSEDYRVQSETGTGLGLSLAREVVRMHGGDITVESEVDRGSTFLVTIPIDQG